MVGPYRLARFELVWEILPAGRSGSVENNEGGVAMPYTFRQLAGRKIHHLCPIGRNTSMKRSWLACSLRCAVVCRCQELSMFICCHFRKTSVGCILLPIRLINLVNSISKRVFVSSRVCLRSS